MTTKAVSIDLWGTIFDFRGEMSASVFRKKLTRGYAAEHGITDGERVDRAYEEAARHFYETYEASAITLSSRDRLVHLFQLIGVRTDGEDFDKLVTAVQDVARNHPPRLAGGLENALGALAEKYRLVVISDTGLTPGRVVRRVFEDYGISQYFCDYSFSDENGKSKPDRYAFESVYERLGISPDEAWHVGDTEWTDVAGAKAVGAKACLYSGLSDDPVDGTRADFVLRKWNDVERLIERIREE